MFGRHMDYIYTCVCTKNFKHDEHAEPRTPAAPRSHYNQVKRLGKITFMVLLLMPQRKRVIHTSPKVCHIQKMMWRGSRPESRAPLKQYRTWSHANAFNIYGQRNGFKRDQTGNLGDIEADFLVPQDSESFSSVNLIQSKMRGYASAYEGWEMPLFAKKKTFLFSTQYLSHS